MTDVREAILDRLVQVVKVDGVTVSRRNDFEGLTDQMLPAAVVMDGDETADDRDPKFRPALSPRRITMTPRVQVTALSQPEVIGTDMNTLRARIILAVLSDAQLLALTADGQGIRYDGLATQFKTTRALQGDMLLMFGFSYYLKPSDL